ncbi:MAG: hypothetical protein EXR64_00595 [Dehalococcoidia bacterium]|nr:hypothetical protein [Dehalococcoidia bacterium]
MFNTIGHTFSLVKTSWRVLMHDRELLLFPVLSGVALLGLIGVFFVIGMGTGTVARLGAAAASGGAGAAVTGVDGIVTFVFLVLAYTIAITFNAALISAALERLRGGDPTVGSGLRAVLPHLPAILGWAVIAATVGMILSALRDRANDNFMGRLAVSLVGGVWAYVTYFVVPVLVVEGLGPIAAIRQSSALFSKTWGNQAVAGFGFGLVYLAALGVAFLPAAALYAASPALGIVVGVLTMSLAAAIVMALEGIFKAALYRYARGEGAGMFDGDTLHDAYRAL